MDSTQVTAIKGRLQLARNIAEEVYGPSPAPEIVSAILNAMSAQEISSRLDSMTDDLCRAAAVTAGN